LLMVRRISGSPLISERFWNSALSKASKQQAKRASQALSWTVV
jgi:hypothetical protein